MTSAAALHHISHTSKFDDRDKIYFRTLPIIVDVYTPSYKYKTSGSYVAYTHRTTIINKSYHVIIVHFIFTNINKLSSIPNCSVILIFCRITNGSASAILFFVNKLAHTKKITQQYCDYNNYERELEYNVLNVDASK